MNIMTEMSWTVGQDVVIDRSHSGIVVKVSPTGRVTVRATNGSVFPDRVFRPDGSNIGGGYARLEVVTPEIKDAMAHARRVIVADRSLYRALEDVGAWHRKHFGFFIVRSGDVDVEEVERAERLIAALKEVFKPT